MPEPSDDEIDRLLARGGLAGGQRERILGEVLTRTATVPRAGQRQRRWVWGGGIGMAVAAGMAAIFFWPRAMDHPAGEFRAKGSAEAPRIEMSCLEARVSACPRGSLIAFSIEGLAQNPSAASPANGGPPRSAGFVTAFADPEPPGERIWYLTNEPLLGLVPGRDDAARIVSKAIRIGDEHVAGSYRVRAMLTSRPLTRQYLVAGEGPDFMSRADFELRVQR
jgi:hypothetical protein